LLVDLLNFVLPLLYLILVWLYGKAFFADSAAAKRLKTPVLVAVVILHAVYLLIRTTEFNHPPATTMFEVFTVLALSVSATYLVIEYRSKAKETGYFILNIAFFFQLISSLFIKDLTEVPEVLRSNLFGLHVSSALLGYAAITISAVYGFLFLMLYHQIKENRFGVIYKKLPTLETLERMNFTAVKMAFVLLGLAIVFGFIWLPEAFTEYSYADPKLIGTLMVWGVYGVGILAKRTAGWTGRKVMILSICGFVLALFSLTFVNVFFTGFHKFQ
jgi:ABC-type transport system involved in cytochrome c biogenesis permease subunit